MKAKTASLSREKVVATAKAKTISTTNNKAISPAKGKAVAMSKKKLASKINKKPVSPSKKKPVSTSKKELNMACQVMDFVEAAFKGKRKAYFVLGTEKTKDGAYIVCVAIENEPGFYKMDWGWHCSFTKAKKETEMMNEKLGLTEEDVNDIIISTMGEPILH